MTTPRLTTYHSPRWDRTVRVVHLETPGLQVDVTDSGASIYRIRMATTDGQWQDIACAPRDMDDFVANGAFMGATVGRYANRIAGAEFTLDGTRYPLLANEGPNQLHGGECWHAHTWDLSLDTEATSPTVVFRRHSPAGEGGFPGAADAEVRYSLQDNALVIDYRVTTDAPTPVNMTNHTYFNLAGADRQALDDHWVTLYADRITETDADSLPTGRLLPVEGTAFDLRQPVNLGQRLQDNPPEVAVHNGYDHNFVYQTDNNADLTTMARIWHAPSGRRLTVASTQPGMQFYCGNFMGGQPAPEPGTTYDNHQAFCCEPQHFPDSPNQPDFPQTVATETSPYAETVIYTFDWADSVAGTNSSTSS